METKIQKQIVTLRKDTFRIDFLRIERIIPKEFYTTIFDKMRTQKNNRYIQLHYLYFGKKMKLIV